MMEEVNRQISRKMSPTLKEIERLPTPLNEGEEKLLNFFIEHLDPKWEIYTQPPLNGVSPDFVLLHPDNGIAVFEVKDWAPDTKNETLVKHQRYNLIKKIQLYRYKLQEALGPSAPKSLFPNITAGLVFPKWKSQKIKAIFDDNFRTIHKFRSDKFLNEFGKETQYKNNLIIGQQNLESGNIKNVFPNFNMHHPLMNEEILKIIRPWLNSSEFDYEQSTEINLDASQYRIVENKDKSKIRRVIGSAGSGKTLVAAGRAATLADESKKVLFCCFNITLKNYLRDCSMRYARNNILNKSCISENITFLNFHSWVKEVFQMYGSEFENQSRSGKELDDNFNNEVLRKIIKRQNININKEFIYYDAIIVDEGQDFSPDWWMLLKTTVLAPDGEMLKVDDATQDIYGTAKSWTKLANGGAGFRGTPNILEKAYRMPVELRELTNKFAETFFPNSKYENSENHLTPIEPIQDAQGSFELRVTQPKVDMKWVMVEENENPIDIFINEILNLEKRAQKLRTDFSMSDIVFLTGKKETGRKVVNKFEEEHNMRVYSTFSENDVENRKEKIGFYKGAPSLKGTTIHSFKGLEGKAVALYIDNAKEESEYRQIYTALTRLKRSENERGLSFIVVVCSDPQFRDYSKYWKGRNLYRRFKKVEQIQADQIGFDYKMLFEDIFIDASSVSLNDPYIRAWHQFKNLKELLNVYHQANVNQKGLEFFLKTGSANGNRQLTLEQQSNELKKICDDAKKLNIDFKWTIDDGFHDRLLSTNLGWSVHLSKGIDIYKRPEPNFDGKDYSNRKCLETRLTYNYRKLSLDEYEKL